MYTLRIPFTLPAGQEIAIADNSSELGDLQYRLEREGRFYVLTLTGFATEGAAKAYIKKVRAALNWVLLQTDLAALAAYEPQEVRYFDDPLQAAANLSRNFGVHIEGRVDALLDGSQPAVYAADKQIRTLTGGLAGVILTTPAEAVLEQIAAGIAIENSDRVVEDSKLLTALELYGAYFSELSANAKFLALIMSLETLATGVPRTALVLNLLEKWRKEAEDVLTTVAPESEDAISLTALQQEMLFRREDSIGRQVRRLVATTLSMNGDADADQCARRAVKLYGVRSGLVHEGAVEPAELTEAMSEAKSIVKRVLRARFLLKAAGRAG